MTAMPSAPPITHGVRSLLLSAMIAVPAIASISAKVPISSRIMPLKLPARKALEMSVAP